MMQIDLNPKWLNHLNFRCILNLTSSRKLNIIYWFILRFDIYFPLKWTLETGWKADFGYSLSFHKNWVLYISRISRLNSWYGQGRWWSFLLGKTCISYRDFFSVRVISPLANSIYSISGNTAETDTATKEHRRRKSGLFRFGAYNPFLPRSHSLPCA